MDYCTSTKSEPNEIIKPELTKEDALEILKTLYGLDGGTLEIQNGYDDLNYHYIKPKNTDNPYITSLWQHGYILKIINTKDSFNIRIQEAQSNLLLFLKNHDTACPQPVKNKHGQYFSVENLPLSNRKTKKHVVKLLEFLPGTLLKNVKNDVFMYYQVGEIAANLNKALKKFHHNAYETHESIWHLTMLPKVKSYTYVVENVELRQVIEGVIDDFIDEVMPKMAQHDKQIIHGDLNTQNIICRKDQEWVVSGVIDFGDSHMSYALYELAISMFYTILDCREKGLDYLVGTGHTLAGYIKADTSWIIDYLMLKRCISARLCQSYVLGLYNSLMQPENNYISENLGFYPQLLRDFTTTPISVIKDTWENVINSYGNSS